MTTLHMSTSEAISFATDAIDFYARLNLPRSASQADIKIAFNRIARVIHPDKLHGVHRDSDSFMKLHEAYDVLSDPERRRIYDLFGSSGLTAITTSRNKTIDELKEEYERVSGYQKKKKMESLLLDSRGIVEVSLDASQCIARDEDTDSLIIHAPYFSSVVMNQMVMLPITTTSAINISGGVVVREGTGGWLAAPGFTFRPTPFTWGECFVSCSSRQNSCGGRLTYNLSRIITLQVAPKVNIVSDISNVRPQVKFSIQRQLALHTTATAALSIDFIDVFPRTSMKRPSTNLSSMLFGMTKTRPMKSDTLFSVAVSHRDPGMRRLAVSTEAGIDSDANLSCKISLNGRVTSKTSAFISTSLSSDGLSLDLNASRRLFQSTFLGFGVSLSPGGVSGNVKFSRGGQKLVVPFTLTDSMEDREHVAIVTSVWCAIGFLFRTFFIRPLEWMRERQIKDGIVKESVRRRLHWCQSLSTIKNPSLSSRAIEEASNGLVILLALYGQELNESLIREFDTIKQRSKIEFIMDPRWWIVPFADVTLSLQFHVCNSELSLNGTSFSSLPYMFDPCPKVAETLNVVTGTEKDEENDDFDDSLCHQLFVRYSYGGRVRETLVDDGSGLHLPLAVFGS